MKIDVTGAARDKLVEYAEEHGYDPEHVYVGAKPGGCAGLQYEIYFLPEDERDEEDYERVVVDGVTFYVEPNHVAVLDGITVSWEDGMVGGGFSVDNPNAEKSCGCGKSFG